MIISGSTSFASAFLASFVEAVEALTIVLAAGTVRGWSSAFLGAGTAFVGLVIITAIFGPALLLLPIWTVKLGLGLFLLILGLKWLRKAVLRAAGAIPLRNEALVYDRTEGRLKSRPPASNRVNWEGFATSFNGVFIEGLEIVFIVLSLGAAGNAMLSTSCGAAVACACVAALGGLFHRPLTRIPENGFKFVVGLLLTSFGIFWGAEGFGLIWPGGDWALGGLLAVSSILAALSVWILKMEIVRTNKLSS
jgi:uncharacterized membrane protein